MARSASGGQKTWPAVRWKTHATFPDGSEGTGLDGLLHYIRQRRQNDFLDNLCRKLLSYALGRTLIVSDDPTVQKMKEQLAANDNRFSTLVETIVTSPQFLTKRGQDELAKELTIRGDAEFSEFEILMTKFEMNVADEQEFESVRS